MGETDNNKAEKKKLVILPVNENDHLVDSICRYLDRPRGRIEWKYFADKTFTPCILSNVRKRDVYIVLNPTNEPQITVEKAFELIDATRRGRAHTITLVAAEHPGHRQDKRHGKRESISVAKYARMFKSLGVDHVITMELHAPQIEGLYDSLDNISAAPIFADYIKKALVTVTDNIVVVSPDAGGMRSATFFGEQFQENPNIAFVHKKRIGVNKSVSCKIVGDVKDKIAIIYDDILDTGGTIIEAARLCKEEGASKIYVCIAHALANNKLDYNPATDRSIQQKMIESAVDEFVFLNHRNRMYTLVNQDADLRKKVTILSIAKYLAEAIKRDQRGLTIREMVKKKGVENLYDIMVKAGQ